MGRDPELHAAGEFLDEVTVSGHPAALLLEGDAGIGKTTVWRSAVELARSGGYRVLTAAPTEAERPLSYAALGDLLGSIPPAILDALPAPQRHAVRVVMVEDEATGEPVERLTVGAGLLGVLRRLVQLGPTLIAIDDAQWLDEPSRAALRFALRRVGPGPLGVLLAARGVADEASALGLERALPEDRIERLPLGPLSVAGLFQVLKSRLGHSFPRPVLTRITDWSGGNPLVALELGRAVLATGRPLEPGMPPPVGPGLTRVLGERIRALSPEERRTLLVVAIAARPTPELVRAACRRLHWRMTLPQTPNLLDQTGSVLRFEHPLLAAEALTAGSVRERRLVHVALGETATDAEEWARHLALAAVSPDEAVAAALDAAARVAAARGAPDAAAELADLAVRLTPASDADALLRRRRELARLLGLSGETGRAVDLLRQAIEDAVPGPDRALARADLARFLAAIGEAGAAIGQCGAALEEARSSAPARARVELAWAAAAQDARTKLAHAENALALLDQGAPAMRAHALVEVVATSVSLGEPVRQDLLDEAVRLEASEPPGRVVVGAAATRAWLHLMDDELALAHGEYSDLCRRARDRGDESSLARMSVELAQIDLRAGRWNEVAAHAAEALQIAEWTGREHDRILALVQIGALAAARGDRPEAERYLGEVRAFAARTGDPFIAAVVAGNLGTLALAEDEPRAAADLFAESARQFGAARYADPALGRFQADHLEALAALGELGVATSLADAIEEQARRGMRRRPLALVARGRGFMAAASGDLEGAAEGFDRSYRAFDELGMRFEAARSLLARGTAHRRLRHKRLAHDDLTQALAVFESLEASMWADRARRELARIGLRPGAPSALTDTEEIVARLAADGRTNKEIATLAFMSARTVEGVMARIYAKLGIASRAELGRAMTGAKVPGSMRGRG